MIGARAIANIQNDQTCVQILNPTHEWVYLKANEPVARIDSIENSDLFCEIDDSSPENVSDITTSQQVALEDVQYFCKAISMKWSTKAVNSTVMRTP